MGKNKKHFLIFDANILIDFIICDRTLISLICTYVGQIYLATPILDEINEIDEGDCVELGIILVEPELEQVISAAENKGALSFQDNLCPNHYSYWNKQENYSQNKGKLFRHFLTSCYS